MPSREWERRKRRKRKREDGDTSCIDIVYVYCILYTYGIDSSLKTILNQSQNVSLIFLLTLLSIYFNYTRTSKFLN